MSIHKKLIILSGGGTLGSVIPLLAMADELRGEYDLLFVGTRRGPEGEFVAKENLPFVAIDGGKWRRYWSWRNISDLFLFFAGWLESFWLLRKTRPALIISAGSFISVPLTAAAWLLRIPVLIHQLDYHPGLANKLMAPLAKRVTVSFEKSLKDYGEKAVWLGSPVRSGLLSQANKSEAYKFFKLNKDKPVVLVVGGGTGAEEINHLIIDNLYNLSQICQIIHLTGRGKEVKVEGIKNYRQFSALSQTEMALALAAADVVVSRAGMGMLSELAFLTKPAIIISMPDSHQEANAQVLMSEQAAVVLNQKKVSALDLYRQIKDLLGNQEKMKSLGKNLQGALKTDASDKMIELIKEIAVKF